MRLTRLYTDLNWDKKILDPGSLAIYPLDFYYIYDAINGSDGPFTAQDTVPDKDTPSYSSECMCFATNINDYTTCPCNNPVPSFGIITSMWSEEGDNLILQINRVVMSSLMDSIDPDIYVESYTITNDATQLDVKSDIKIEWVGKRIGANYKANAFRTTAKKSLFTPVGTDNMYSGTITLKEATYNITETHSFKMQLLLAKDMNQP